MKETNISVCAKKVEKREYLQIFEVENRNNVYYIENSVFCWQFTAIHNALTKYRIFFI